MCFKPHNNGKILEKLKRALFFNRFSSSKIENVAEKELRNMKNIQKVFANAIDSVKTSELFVIEIIKKVWQHK